MARTNDLCPLLLVEAATLISGMGNGISLVALPWLVLELTGRATAAGITLVALGTMVLPSLRLLGDLPDTPPDETYDDRTITSWAH
jgi:hypothetical protein